MEQVWKAEKAISKINKEIIQTEFETRPDDVKEGEIYEPTKSILTFDRVEGTVKLRFKNKEKEEFKFKCIKISKSDLPTKEIKQKF